MRRISLALLSISVLISQSLFGQIRPEEAELHLALQLGDVQRTLAAFEGSADPNAVDERGFTALNYAAASPTAEVIAYVVRNGAEYNPAKHKEAPILTAAKYGNYKQGMVLIQSGHAAASPDAQGWNALFFAAARNDGPFVSLLLQNGVPIQPGGGHSYSALHHAAKHGASQALFPMLRQYGGDPNAQDEQGWTPLHHAAQAGKPRAVKILLDAGADPNAQASGGIRPLHLAAQSGHHKVVSTLLGKGALVMLPDSSAANAIHFACAAGHLNVLQNLLGKGAETNVPDGNGKFPLQMALENGHGLVAKSLIRAGAAKELAHVSDELHAILSGDMEQLKGLIQDKAAANKKELGTPLLAWAIRAGQEGMANYLLDMGADPLEKDAQGMPAVHLAVRFALQGLVERLASDPSGRRLQDGRGRTPAQVAVECNRHLFLEALMDNEVAKMTDQQGRGLLHAAVEGDIPMTVLPILFRWKVRPDKPDQKLNFPLHFAVEKGDAEVVRMLLDYWKAREWYSKRDSGPEWRQIDILNTGNENGDMPLHQAAGVNDVAMVKFLLEAGANPEIRNSHGKTPAQYALENWKMDAFGVLVRDQSTR